MEHAPSALADTDEGRTVELHVDYYTVLTSCDTSQNHCPIRLGEGRLPSTESTKASLNATLWDEPIDTSASMDKEGEVSNSRYNHSND